MSEEDKQKMKEYGKGNRKTMSEENKQKKREYIKEYLKEYKENQSNNVLKKKIDKFKRFEVYAVTTFIKDEVESSSYDNVNVNVDITTKS